MNKKYQKKAIRVFLWMLLISFHSFLSYSQDYSWWNKKHNWDGVTSWSKYLIISPAYMGPNALPVPDFNNGTLKERGSLKFAAESHFSKGDNTQNLFTRLYLPLYTDKVGLLISIIPFEHYKMDTITRDLRRTRDFDGKGFAGGDFYIGTFIQILKDKKHWPDMAVSINLKTASGTNLEAARYTETPGYFFDLSMGKNYAAQLFCQGYSSLWHSWFLCLADPQSCIFSK